MESVKQELINQNTHSQSLSKNVVVYARKPDDADTIVIRDLISIKFNVFGMKGVKNIEHLFHGIVTLLLLNRENVLIGLKYGADDRLKEFLDSVEDKQLCDVDVINDKQTVKIGNDFRIDLRIAQKHVQLGLLNLKNDGCFYRVDNGVYLFISSVEKLLRYLNERFNFDEGARKKNLTINSYEHDNFF